MRHCVEDLNQDYLPAYDYLIDCYENGAVGVRKNPEQVAKYREGRRNADNANRMKEYKICACGRKIFRPYPNAFIPDKCEVCEAANTVTMKCSKCGAKISGFETYCLMCGAKIDYFA